jgi:hypothetical protein
MGCHIKEDKQKGLVYFNDLETSKGWVPNLRLTKSPVYSGIFSNRLDSEFVYGLTFKLRFKEIYRGPVKRVKFSMQCYLKTNSSKGKIVISVETKFGKNVFWNAKKIKELTSEAEKWVELKGEFDIPQNNVWSPDNFISIYPWNEGKEEFFVDDFRIEFCTSSK